LRQKRSLLGERHPDLPEGNSLTGKKGEKGYSVKDSTLVMEKRALDCAKK